LELGKKIDLSINEKKVMEENSKNKITFKKS
jgi:hypothetical protein